MTARGRYAVMAMVDLAGSASAREGSAVRLTEIATRQEISLAFLEQIFCRLRQAGLVSAVRSPGGKPCMKTLPGQPGGRCQTHDLWAALGNEIERFLTAVTLADVLGGRLAQPAATAA